MTMSTTPIPIILFLFLFLTSSSFASSAAHTTSFQSFVQCFLENTPESNDLFYPSNSSSYGPVLQSSVQNLRFLVSRTNKKPSAIITPKSESHISAIVRCAYKYRLELRTRSGGHDYEGMSYVSDDTEHPFVIVDLASFRTIDIDHKSRTAWVQAGATLGEVYYDVFTKTNGALGFPAGICLTVAVGGHISTGGMGAMTRKFGTAADNVINAKVVGIDGRILDRSQMGEDLFWALRGGGAASFGVVVAYELQLVEVPPVVSTFSIYRNSSQNVTKLVTRWQEIAPNLDENVFLRTVAQAVPGTERVWKVNIEVQFISLFLGNCSRLLSTMEKSFPELGVKAGDCTDMTWLESALFMYGMSGKGVEALLNRTPEFNSSFKGKSDFVTERISETQWEGIWRALADLRDMETPIMMIMEPFGGRMNEISESEIPFPHRKGNLYNIQYFMRWFGTGEQENERQLNSMRNLYSFMAPYVSRNPRRAYYNYKDIDLGRTDGMLPSYFVARQWGEKYFKSNFERLAKVKRQVDPMNFFRNEQSIPPLYYIRNVGSTASTLEE